MNLNKCIPFILICLALFVGSVQAQIPIGPFAPMEIEDFDALAPGFYENFVGFNGHAEFSRTTNANRLWVLNDPALLPAISNPNSMFGRGTDVRIDFKSVLNQFGGFFRVPNAGVPVNQVQFIFYKSCSPPNSGDGRLSSSNNDRGGLTDGITDPR